MNAYELGQALDNILGECVDERWDEWWEKYTGANAFFHMLSGETGFDADPDERVKEKVTAKDGGLEVEGLGLFKKVEVYDDNFDMYEKSADTNLVFEFDGNFYRVDGSFDSHRGGVWDSTIEQVYPTEKTIRVWERA